MSWLTSGSGRPSTWTEVENSVRSAFREFSTMKKVTTEAFDMALAIEHESLTTEKAETHATAI